MFRTSKPSRYNQFPFPFCALPLGEVTTLRHRGSLKTHFRTSQEYNFQTFPKSGISSKNSKCQHNFFTKSCQDLWCQGKWMSFPSVFYMHAGVHQPSTLSAAKTTKEKKGPDSVRQPQLGETELWEEKCRIYGLAPKTILKVISRQVLRCEDKADWENSFDRIFQQTNAWQGFVIYCYVVCYSTSFGYPTCISKNVPNIWKTLKDDVGRIHSPVWNQPQELYLHTQMHEHEIGFACKSRTCFLIDFVGTLQWALYRKKQFWEKFSFGLQVKSQPQKSQILNVWSIESIANIWGLVI